MNDLIHGAVRGNMTKPSDVDTASVQSIVPRPPRVGDIIRLTKDIYWDGEDCHPPECIARKGDIMQVRKLRGYNVIAAHTPLTQTMFIEQEEYEFVN